MRTVGLIVVTALALASALNAQAEPQGGPTPPPNAIDYANARFGHVAEAVRTRERITLDGHLDERDWQQAAPATDFVQWEPVAGAPASERTEVRFLYDESNLYIGATCFDSQPDRMVVKDLKEDFSPNDSDFLGIFLDTLHDARSGFLFATNPAGAKHDVQASHDGDEANIDWDGVWDVRVSVDERGWVAEFRIPFRTLRFASIASQEWGLNVVRRVRRLNEDSNWSPLPRRYRVSRASMAGTLRGIDSVRQGRNLKVKPFATGGFTDLWATASPTAPRTRDNDFDAGIDLKYGVTQELTLDATYRTDFSQVEVDQQQVNLTRFNLLFPEKREFFLENRGIFNVASMSNGGADPVIPFFSRRIGLSSDGFPIPIVGGARLSGKAGTYDVGLIAMRTEHDGAVPANTFLVGRVAKYFRSNTWIGGLVTERDSTVPGDHNETFGVDGNVRVFEKLELSVYAFQSHTSASLTDRRGRNQARMFEAVFEDDDLSLRAQYDIVQPNFNPEVGFVRRRNTEHYTGTVVWRPRPKRRQLIRNYSFMGDYDYYGTASSGELEISELQTSAGISFQNSSSVTVNANFENEHLLEPFNIHTGVAIPVGEYPYQRYGVNTSTDRSRAVSGGFRLETGEFWNGDSTSYGGNLELRPNRHFNLNLNFSRNHVDLPNGQFTTTLVGTRVLLAFTSRMFLNSFVQYNADTRQFSSNTRFNIIHRPLSDLFIVYNDRRDTTAHRPLERTFIVKFTNMFEF